MRLLAVGIAECDTAVQLLWRFNNEAIHLRVQHHITAQKGMEAHTVFVRDIPGIPSGTIINRIETRALRYLPGFIQVRGLTLRPAASH